MRFSLCCLFALIPLLTFAQSESLPKRLDQKLTKRYYNSKYDSTYVARPEEKWLLRLLLNQTGNHIYARGTVGDVWSKYDLHSKYKTTLGLEVNYCDIAASLSMNPAKMNGDYRDYELNFEYHGQQFSFDISYLRSSSLTGDIRLGDMNHLEEDGLHMNVVNLAAYYIFNHRQFSFPAALYQNYYQLRSAGSWLAGLSYQGGSIKTTDELKQRSPQAPYVHLTFSNIGIGGGYGYNWVPDRRSQWLLHLSALPNFVVFKQNKLSINNYEVKDKNVGLKMILNSRAAVVYHISPRYNIGATFNMSTPLFNNDKVVVNQTKWMAHIFFGLRL